MRLFFKYKISDETLNDLKETANIIGNSQVVELISQRQADIS